VTEIPITKSGIGISQAQPGKNNLFKNACTIDSLASLTLVYCI